MIVEPKPIAGNGPSGGPSPDFAIAQRSPLPMAMLEGSGHIIRDVNPAFCHLFTRNREQLVGESFFKIVPEQEKWRGLYDSVIRTGKPGSHTEREASQQHTAFWSYTMWPVMVAEHPVGILLQVTETTEFHEKTMAMNEALTLGSVRQHELTQAAEELNVKLRLEIAEREQVEASLRLVEAQLADRAGQLEGLVTLRTAELTTMNEQLEAFVYSIAHDLRAPLRVMQGFSTMLLETAGDTLNKTGRHYANRINQSAQFMDAMLLDLLTFSQVSQQLVELARVDLKTVVESVLESLQKDIQEKHAHLENSGPWPVLMAHEQTLVQVLFNLVSNALKFVVPGVSPIVRLWTEERGEFLRVWVEDNGPGIAADHQGQIFRLFTRLDGEKYSGTGIGLTIVQKGIERMGGAVGVESEIGRGSRFWFELPRVGQSPSTNNL